MRIPEIPRMRMVLLEPNIILACFYTFNQSGPDVLVQKLV
ncbi:hypothetical protein CBM2626_B110303 [Cupriavidus taiwanensis]|nr:hypothetical protein CBM2626_B110303 [Cupriavidus taiwanensis]